MNAVMDGHGSRYKEEIHKSIIHFTVNFFQNYCLHQIFLSLWESICARLTRQMAACVLTFFVQHAILARPLSESGKLWLTWNMAELELVVG